MRRSHDSVICKPAPVQGPFIAAINGPCTGAGLQITLSCDLRIASDQAKFGFRENNIGLKIGRASCREREEVKGTNAAEDGIRDADVTGVQTCALPIS